MCLIFALESQDLLILLATEILTFLAPGFRFLLDAADSMRVYYCHIN